MSKGNAILNNRAPLTLTLRCTCAAVDILSVYQLEMPPTRKQKGGRIRWTYKRPKSIPYDHLLGPRGCHPGIKGSKDSCIPEATLRTQGTTSRKELCNKLGCKGDSDGELLKVLSPELRKEWMTKYFRPKAPEEWKKDPDDWLDNHSIEAVLKQYEEADPSFKSLGAVPIDFAAPNPYGRKDQCMLPEFCRLNLDELRRSGKTGVGFVFNLDPHFKDGSHWVGMYLDVGSVAKPPAVYYFDSYGYPPPKQIRLLMETFWSQDKRTKLAYNGRRFQYSASECGVYSIYFVICMHGGVRFKRFVKHRVKDEVMLYLRSWFFNVEPVVVKEANLNNDPKNPLELQNEDPK